MDIIHKTKENPEHNEKKWTLVRMEIIINRQGCFYFGVDMNT